MQQHHLRPEKKYEELIFKDARNIETSAPAVNRLHLLSILARDKGVSQLVEGCEEARCNLNDDICIYKPQFQVETLHMKSIACVI